jgi:L-aspartate oxidase
VVPAAHYSCGGVVTDEHGRTNVDGLLVVGEAACTGLHGANRLASNSLLEGLVFGNRAAKIAAKLKARWRKNKPGLPIPKWDHGQAAPSDENVLIAHAWDEIRRLMWNYVGIVRSNHRLDRALGRIRLIKSEIRSDYWKYRLTSDLIEVRNLALVAEMIITCAMMRKESRGLHWNVNYPYVDDERFLRNTVL